MFSLISGNATANMNTQGLTNLVSLNDNDDGSAQFPVNFDFYFFGTNYGNGLNNGIFWSSNSFLNFGNGPSSPSVEDLVNFILIGHFDRRNNSFWYSNTLTTSSGSTYVRTLYFGQNFYDDDIPNALQYEINIMRDRYFQYIEIRIASIGVDNDWNVGDWNVKVNGVNQNTCGNFQATGPVVGGSYVFKSNLSGQNWEFLPNYHIDIT
jgi:hypothetical protein